MTRRLATATVCAVCLAVLVGWLDDQPYYWECWPWYWHLLEPWCLWR